MDALETVFETAGGLVGIVELLGNELVVGLGVAIGLIVWLVAGRKDDGVDTSHHPHHP